MRSLRITKDQSGVTAIEFAMIAPVFMMIVSGIIELSLIMFTNNVLESATNITARLGSTGYVASGTTRQQEIINSVDSQTGGYLNTGLIDITSTVYSNFEDAAYQSEPCINPTTPPCPGTKGVNFIDINGNGVWDANLGTAGLGNAGDVVVYKVSYPWHINTPIISSIFGSTYTITASAVVRNEPYSTGGR